MTYLSHKDAVIDYVRPLPPLAYGWWRLSDECRDVLERDAAIMMPVREWFPVASKHAELLIPYAAPGLLPAQSSIARRRHEKWTRSPWRIGHVHDGRRRDATFFLFFPASWTVRQQATAIARFGLPYSLRPYLENRR